MLDPVLSFRLPLLPFSRFICRYLCPYLYVAICTPSVISRTHATSVHTSTWLSVLPLSSRAHTLPLSIPLRGYLYSLCHLTHTRYLCPYLYVAICTPSIISRTHATSVHTSTWLSVLPLSSRAHTRYLCPYLYVAICTPSVISRTHVTSVHTSTWLSVLPLSSHAHTLPLSIPLRGILYSLCHLTHTRYLCPYLYVAICTPSIISRTHTLPLSIPLRGYLYSLCHLAHTRYLCPYLYVAICTPSVISRTHATSVHTSTWLSVLPLSSHAHTLPLSIPLRGYLYSLCHLAHTRYLCPYLYVAICTPSVISRTHATSVHTSTWLSVLPLSSHAHTLPLSIPLRGYLYSLYHLAHTRYLCPYLYVAICTPSIISRTHATSVHTSTWLSVLPLSSRTHTLPLSIPLRGYLYSLYHLTHTRYLCPYLYVAICTPSVISRTHATSVHTSTWLSVLPLSSHAHTLPLSIPLRGYLYSLCHLAHTRYLCPYLYVAICTPSIISRTHATSVHTSTWLSVFPLSSRTHTLPLSIPLRGYLYSLYHLTHTRYLCPYLYVAICTPSVISRTHATSVHTSTWLSVLPLSSRAHTLPLSIPLRGYLYSLYHLAHTRYLCPYLYVAICTPSIISRTHATSVHTSTWLSVLPLSSRTHTLPLSIPLRGYLYSLYHLARTHATSVHTSTWLSVLPLSSRAHTLPLSIPLRGYLYSLYHLAHTRYLCSYLYVAICTPSIISHTHATSVHTSTWLSVLPLSSRAHTLPLSIPLRGYLYSLYHLAHTRYLCPYLYVAICTNSIISRTHATSVHTSTWLSVLPLSSRTHTLPLSIPLRGYLYSLYHLAHTRYLCPYLYVAICTPSVISRTHATSVHTSTWLSVLPLSSRAHTLPLSIPLRGYLYSLCHLTHTRYLCPYLYVAICTPSIISRTHATSVHTSTWLSVLPLSSRAHTLPLSIPLRGYLYSLCHLAHTRYLCPYLYVAICTTSIISRTHTLPLSILLRGYLYSLYHLAHTRYLCPYLYVAICTPSIISRTHATSVHTSTWLSVLPLSSRTHTLPLSIPLRGYLYSLYHLAHTHATSVHTSTWLSVLPLSSHAHTRYLCPYLYVAICTPSIISHTHATSVHTSTWLSVLPLSSHAHTRYLCPYLYVAICTPSIISRTHATSVHTSTWLSVLPLSSHAHTLPLSIPLRGYLYSLCHLAHTRYLCPYLYVAICTPSVISRTHPYTKGTALKHHCMILFQMSHRMGH